MAYLLMKFKIAALPAVVLATAVLAGCNIGAERPAAAAANSSAAANAPSEPVATHMPDAAPANALAAGDTAGGATAHHAPDTPTPSPVIVDATAPAAEEERYRTVTVPAGTTLSLVLQSSVSSDTSSVEDRVAATLRRPLVVNGVTVAPAGASVSGYVTESTRSGRVKGRARVGVRFTSLRARDGVHNIRTATISRQARATKKQDATKIGIGAGAGAVVGAVAGGKKGAAIGSAVGGAGGTGVVLATRGEEVALGTGTIVTTRLTAPLTVRVRVP
jgi:hypothetical protein